MPDQNDVMKHLLTTERGLYLTQTLGRGNRSHGLRIIVTVIIQKYEEGDDTPFELAIDLAQRTPLQVRRAIDRGAGRKSWFRTTGWIPAHHINLIERNIAKRGIRSSDWLRGAVLGATQEDPAKMISDDGSELWEFNTTHRA